MQLLAEATCSLPYDTAQAHVYLRLPEGKTMDDIPPEVLEDACQLVKANSIQVGGDCLSDWNGSKKHLLLLPPPLLPPGQDAQLRCCPRRVL